MKTMPSNTMLCVKNLINISNPERISRTNIFKKQNREVSTSSARLRKQAECCVFPDVAEAVKDQFTLARYSKIVRYIWIS